MSEGSSDFELFTGPAPSEKKEMSDEKFNEQMRKTQQAIQDLKKEEGKAKAHDNSLASIIVQFLSQPQNTDLFLLISRVVAQNVPSELIIAILSLVDKSAHKETKGILKAAENGEEETALALHEKVDFQTLSPALKRSINMWTSDISKVAMNKPQRALETIIVPGPDRELSSTVVQLSAFILRNYLAEHNADIEFQNLRDFMMSVFVEIVKNLEELLQGQKHISS